jgi:predicted O-methyltransferase YrrM
MEFTEAWFAESAAFTWEQLIPEHFPDGIGKALEIGSYEGMSACWLLGRARAKDLLCVDTWQGSDEEHFEHVNMEQVHARFQVNIAQCIKAPGAVVRAWQMTSAEAMKKLLDDGQGNTFDFIYIDGSHIAADVLSDACYAFRLLKPGGWIYFDDYNWTDITHPGDPKRTPKAGIDSFIALYLRKIRFLRSKYQMHVQKL